MFYVLSSSDIYLNQVSDTRIGGIVEMARSSHLASVSFSGSLTIIGGKFLRLGGIVYDFSGYTIQQSASYLSLNISDTTEFEVGGLVHIYS